ncbi:unnamed protein product [Calypogeia fissa]
MMGSLQLDMFMAVDELHGLSARDMSKLLKDPHSFTFRFSTTKGSSMRVDVQRLATSLPLHLLALVVSTGPEPRFRYLLRGVRLLHSLSDLALRYPKLEQLLLHEVKLREQVLDFVIYMLIVLASVEQEARVGSFIALLHAALVACCLYLLTAFVTREWHDVVPVLLAHPKVEIFMDAAFDVVRRDIGLLQSKLRTLHIKLASKKATLPAAERVGEATAQQCEASLQVLQSLCQTQAFRDQLLHHTELCRRGGVLRLTLAVLKLQMPSSLQQSKSLVAFISRLKSKALSMMLKFCETESVSFLDEIAADVRSMHLAELVAGEILALVRSALLEEPRRIEATEAEQNPMGSLHINAMRLADLLSDDSNFRNIVMDNTAPDLGTVLAAPPGVFASRWCEGDIAVNLAKGEMDATLIYDPFQAAGAAMLASAKGATAPASGGPGSSVHVLEEMDTGCVLSIESTSPDHYARERSALLVKLFGNLYCYNPEVCSVEEKDRFLHMFVGCLQSGPLHKSDSSHFLTPEQTAVRICENLHVLLDHVVSSSHTVNDEDLLLVSTFSDALHDAICPAPPDESSSVEAPVVSFVRDAHEKKRQIVHARRQQLPRWQKIKQSSAELLGREGVSATVTPTNIMETPAHSQDSVEIDTHKGVVIQPDSRPQRPFQIARRDITPAAINLQQLRKEAFLDAVDGQGYEERTKEGVEDIGTNNLEADLDPENDEDDLATTPLPVRNPKRRREPKKSLDTDERNVVFKKRKRNIMNEHQIRTIEDALKGEPEMQRFPKLIQHWTNHLNEIGPEIAVHQLKNWLNNRKARLARIAREERGPEVDIRGENSRQTRSAPGSAADQLHLTPTLAPDLNRSGDGTQRDPAVKLSGTLPISSGKKDPPEGGGLSRELTSLDHKQIAGQDLKAGVSSGATGRYTVGLRVRLSDLEGKEVALGIVCQTEGEWNGRNLEEQNLCVTLVTEFKVAKTTKLPYPSNLTGTTFEEAETLQGEIKVAWNKDRLFLVPDNKAK